MHERYLTPEMRGIWSDQTYVNNMVMVEMAHLNRMHPTANDDLVGGVAVKEVGLRAYFKGEPPILADHVRLKEKETGHEVTALLSILDDILGHNLVHAGLTSSDVTDTARALQMRDAHQLLRQATDEFFTFLEKEAQTVADVAIIARTHGQYAVPSTLGHRFINYAHLMRLVTTNLNDTYPMIRGKMSGAVGTHVFIEKRQEVGLCSELGVPASTYSTQIVPRTSWLQAWNAVLGAATACEKIANDLRILSQSGVREYLPPPPKHSSSTMVHKANPATLERVIGLMRYVRHAHAALAEGVANNWLERDLTNTSVERIALPQLYGFTEYAVRTLRQQFDVGLWDVDRMRINLDEAIEAGALNEAGYVQGLVADIPREQARTATIIAEHDKAEAQYIGAATNDVRRGRTS